ncbi:DUF5994 family protein [Microtetraspora glauca]|uniref:DUF5994 family protein n=1 Tax=Microtetraspora glauca TaxID=1996 RepID=A0ABV3GT89_MICGL
MTPQLLYRIRPSTPFSVTVMTDPHVVRLNLDSVPDSRRTVDGMWWPSSRDAAAELPRLIAAVDQRLGGVTVRVDLNPDVWDDIPRDFPARGRLVEVNDSRDIDSHLVGLTTTSAGHTSLLLMAPGAVNASAA